MQLDFRMDPRMCCCSVMMLWSRIRLWPQSLRMRRLHSIFCFCLGYWPNCSASKSDEDETQAVDKDDNSKQPNTFVLMIRLSQIGLSLVDGKVWWLIICIDIRCIFAALRGCIHLHSRSRVLPMAGWWWYRGELASFSSQLRAETSKVESLFSCNSFIWADFFQSHSKRRKEASIAG